MFVLHNTKETSITVYTKETYQNRYDFVSWGKLHNVFYKVYFTEKFHYVKLKSAKCINDWNKTKNLYITTSIRKSYKNRNHLPSIWNCSKSFLCNEHGVKGLSTHYFLSTICSPLTLLMCTWFQNILLRKDYTLSHKCYNKTMYQSNISNINWNKWPIHLARWN